jgi:AcrR family transcriptional regulator
MPAVLQLIEEHFAAEGRTPKGRKARLAIFRATRDLMTRRGLHATSLEVIADRAGLTQAALRHYFATREELLHAFFVAATRWFQSQIIAQLKDGELPAGEQLENCLSWHLEYMENVDTAFWLEGSAYWLQHPPPRHTRDEFYGWLMRQYSKLISGIRPGLGNRECQRRAYTLLTLVLGAWITHGRGSAVTGAGSAVEQRRLLVATAMEIVRR